MKKFLKIAATFTILMLVLAVIPASAKINSEKGMGMQNCSENKDGMMNMPNLNLTEEQIAKMDKIRLTHKKSMIELKYKLELKMVDFMELMSNNPDEKKALSMIDEVSKIKTEMEKSKIMNHFAMRGILNKDQQKIFDKIGNGMIMEKGMGNHKGMNEGFNQNEGNNCNQCGE